MANKKLSLRSFFKSEEQEEAEVKAEMRETYSYEDLINLVYPYAKENAARSDLDATPRIRITPEQKELLMSIFSTIGEDGRGRKKGSKNKTNEL